MEKKFKKTKGLKVKVISWQMNKQMDKMIEWETGKSNKWTERL